MRRNFVHRCQVYKGTDLFKKLCNLLCKNKVEKVDISKYTVDWTKQYNGGSIVVKPSNTEDVVKIIQFCHQEKIPIVPQGGNTGLVGGQVGMKNEVIISMEKMNKIIKIDTISAIAVVEAGCILEVLNKETEKVGYILPIDLGAKGSCHIGGNVATNAGGLRLLRYGSLHQNITGLEVVKADGTILNMLRTLHKDNCGYHLKNMFVGSEGTLGVITKVAIQLRPVPTSVQVSLIKLQSYLSLPTLISRIRSNLSDIISALEFIDAPSVQAVQLDNPNITSKLSSSSLLPNITTQYTTDNSGFSSADSTSLSSQSVIGCGIPGEVLVLLECSGCHHDNDKQRIEDLLGQMMEEGVVVDAMIAQDQTQVQNVWALRETVPVSLMHLSRIPYIYTPTSSATPSTTTLTTSSTLATTNDIKNTDIVPITGRLYKYDVSLSVAEWPLLVQHLKQQCTQLGFPVSFYSDSNPNSHPDTTTTISTLSMNTIQNEKVFAKIKSNSNQKLLQKYKDIANIQVCCFGHVGDQNLHLNILLTWKNKMFTESSTNILEIDEYKQLLKLVLDQSIFTYVINCNGSISAEHGLGQQKSYLLTQARSVDEVNTMVGLKKLMDPLNILNPGKVIPVELLS